MAVERVLLKTETLLIGRFRCPPGDRRWRTENWIGREPHVVFPLRPVGIAQAGRRPVVANPNHVVLYDGDQTYRRELLSPDGDVATYVSIARGVARSFAAAEVPLAADVLLDVQLLARDLATGDVDRLAAEERMLGILAGVLDRPDRRRAPSDRRRRGTRLAHEDVVEDAKRLISVRFAASLTIGQIGRAVGASPFHLARLFRARTGWSLHGYREQIRLRHALARLTDERPAASLETLALELGFVSHAHLDDRFSRTFGLPPSAVRRLGRREMRTIMEGAAALPA